jgi:hypothetical protein
LKQVRGIQASAAASESGGSIAVDTVLIGVLCVVRIAASRGGNG